MREHRVPRARHERAVRAERPVGEHRVGHDHSRGEGVRRLARRARGGHTNRASATRGRRDVRRVAGDRRCPGRRHGVVQVDPQHWRGDVVLGREDPVIAVTAAEDVGAGTALEHVLAPAACHELVALVALDPFAAGAAGQDVAPFAAADPDAERQRAVGGRDDGVVAAVRADVEGGQVLGVADRLVRVRLRAPDDIDEVERGAWRHP
jgi:hypothetical protein